MLIRPRGRSAAGKAANYVLASCGDAIRVLRAECLMPPGLPMHFLAVVVVSGLPIIGMALILLLKVLPQPARPPESPDTLHLSSPTAHAPPRPQQAGYKRSIRRRRPNQLTALSDERLRRVDQIEDKIVILFSFTMPVICRVALNCVVESQPRALAGKPGRLLLWRRVAHH